MNSIVCHCEKIINRFFLRKTAWVMVLAITIGLGGCSSLPSAQLTRADIDIVRVNSHWANIGLPRIMATEKTLEVSGYLKKSRGRKGKIPGHLHLEAHSKAGKVLVESLVRYHRHQPKSASSHYDASLAVEPGLVRSIRLVHHGISSLPCVSS